MESWVLVSCHQQQIHLHFHLKWSISAITRLLQPGVEKPAFLDSCEAADHIYSTDSLELVSLPSLPNSPCALPLQQL